jgi:hypothetical protein
MESRKKDVVITTIGNTKIFNYKGIEVDKDTWEQAPCPMCCKDIDDNNMCQIAIYLYDKMVEVYGEEDVKQYVSMIDRLANFESYDVADIQYYDEMDSFRWREEEELFIEFGAVYYEDYYEDMN